MKHPLDSRRCRRLARRFWIGVEGPELDVGEREIVAAFPPGGVVLFARNLASAKQVRRLIEELRRLAGPSLVVAIDQEGGKVDRLATIDPPRPSAESLASEGTRACQREGRRTGRRLRGLDIDLDLAPVVDLQPAAAATIGFAGRAFATTPRDVIRFGGAFLSGLRESGVGGCLKHFPGLGSGAVDSHHGLPVIRSAARHLRAVDGEPFRALAAEAAAVMVSHAVYPALDRAVRPASISPAIVGGELVRRLGYRRAILTDDLEMGALAGYGELPRRSLLALRAGASELLICRRLSDVPECVLATAQDIDERTLAAAEARSRALRHHLAALRRRAEA